MKHITVAIIGVGAVGSTIAYALLLKNSVAEIILVDVDIKRCAGEVRDLADALGLSAASRLYQGSYDDAKKADIVIISAGVPQKPGQTRIELVDKNKHIMKQVLIGLKGINPNTVLIIVANPLDILTYQAHKTFELPPAQMFGTGTFLDSHRLKHILSCNVGIAEESIDAFVLGEHGDSEFVAWSATRIGGAPVERFGITQTQKEEIARSVKAEAYEIIQAKGATFYGIATCVATLCEMIIFNTKQVVPVSWYHDKYKVCMSLPAVLGERGVERVIELEFTSDELRLLQLSADTLKPYLL